jgi:3-hydroxyisobutyrate dehydrogenase
MRVGLLGTGLLGTAMARRLLGRGVPLAVWNRSRHKLTPLVAEGATPAATPAELLAGVDVAVLLLADADAIRRTLLAAGTRSALAGRTVIQMGTIAPDESRALADEVFAAGGEWLEAPVLGSLPQALDGSLVVMVGGTPEQLARWRGLLEQWGPEPLHVGEVGAAAALKLALNQLIATETVAFAHSLALVRRSGVDPELFLRILRGSALYAPTFDKKLPRMTAGRYDDPNFPTRHLLKDVELFEREADRLGVRAPALEGVRTTILAALAAGHGEDDYSAIYEAVDEGRGRSSGPGGA